jgi:REP element-mobilizing transposase RayT
MNRGRRQEKTFKDGVDYDTFVRLLVESTDLWSIRVVAYCLMPNHYHLLLQTPLPNLSRCMRHINGVYTQKFNRRHEADGQVFRGRYKSILVEADRYLLELVRYIHRNPVRAGLVRKPARYQWSSHRSYISMTGHNSWLAKDLILSQFGGSRSGAIASFEAFMGDQDSAEIRDFYSRKRVAAVIGGDDFLEHLKRRFSGEKLHKEIPESGFLRPTFDDIAEAVCQTYGIDYSDLVPGVRGQHTEARAIAAYLARRYAGERLRSLAEKFGFRRHGSVGKMIQRLIERAVNEKRLEETIARLEIQVRGGNAST